MDLDKYLELKKISIRKLADSIGYDFQYVRKIVNRRLMPGTKLAKSISKWSRGMVSEEDILNQGVITLKEEKELLRKIRDERKKEAM